MKKLKKSYLLVVFQKFFCVILYNLFLHVIMKDVIFLNKESQSLSYVQSYCYFACGCFGFF